MLTNYRPICSRLRPLWPLACGLGAVLLALSCGSDEAPSVVPTDEQRQQLEALRLEAKSLREQSQFVEAINLDNKVVSLAEECRDTLAWVRAQNDLGTNYRRIGSLNDATEHHLRALVTGQKMSRQDDPYVRKQQVVSLNGLGNVYLSIGNLEQADSMFRRALAGETALGSALGQAINLANLGSIQEMKGQTDSAWAYYRQSMEKNRECESQLGIALCHNHFGQLYEKSGQTELALREYELAIETMAGSDDEWHRLESRLNMAHARMNRGEMAQARRLLDDALETARKIGSVEHRAETHRLFYEFYMKTGDQRQALDHFVRATALEDSVVDIHKVAQIQNARLAFERQKSQYELQVSVDNLAQERRMRHAFMWGAVIMALLLIGFTAMLMYVMHIRAEKERITRSIQKARETFFTNVTHEFRTPLTVIMGLSRQLAHAKMEDLSHVHSSAKMIVRQGNSLLNLINQLLDVSKVRSAVGEAQWRRGDIVAFVAMNIENFRPLADAKRIELSFSHSLTSLVTDFVPDYLLKIVSNLVANAIKYTGDYGKVNVTLEQTSGQRIKLQVFDTGRGIPKQSMPHLFDAFYQAENDSAEIGTGIGLSMVKLMTEAMGGTVEVQSVEGQGSTFTVLFPMLEHEGTPGLEAATAVRKKPEVLPEPAPEEAPLPAGLEQGTRILIVEDNQDIASYIGTHLQDSHQLFYARSGEEAVDKALELLPDMIITDLMMPGEVNGLQLCRRIRQSEQLPHVPIIIITAKTTNADRVKGIEAGADAYLVKPFNSDELLALVGKFMERHRMLKEHLAQVSPEQGEARQPLSHEDRNFLGKFIDIVYRLMAQGRIDVESIAAQMGMSRSQLNRRIMAITGQNTSNYMMQLRLARAKRMLKTDQQVTVSDIALKCGFDDVAYFSRIFKQHFKMTPTQFRKTE